MVQAFLKPLFEDFFMWLQDYSNHRPCSCSQAMTCMNLFKSILIFFKKTGSERGPWTVRPVPIRSNPKCWMDHFATCQSHMPNTCFTYFTFHDFPFDHLLITSLLGSTRVSDKLTQRQWWKITTYVSSSIELKDILRHLYFKYFHFLLLLPEKM